MKALTFTIFLLLSSNAFANRALVQLDSSYIQDLIENGNLESAGKIITDEHYIALNDKARAGICQGAGRLEYDIAHDTLQAYAEDSEELMKAIKEETDSFFKITNTIYEINYIECRGKTLFQIRDELNDIYSWSRSGHFKYEENNKDKLQSVEDNFPNLDGNAYKTYLNFKGSLIHLSANYSKNCAELSLKNDGGLLNVLNSYLRKVGREELILINYNNDGLGCETKVIIKTTKTISSKNFSQAFKEFVIFHKDKYNLE
jgi:hypothetical protein